MLYAGKINKINNNEKIIIGCEHMKKDTFDAIYGNGELLYPQKDEQIIMTNKQEAKAMEKIFKQDIDNTTPKTMDHNETTITNLIEQIDNECLDYNNLNVKQIKRIQIDQQQLQQVRNNMNDPTKH